MTGARAARLLGQTAALAVAVSVVTCAQAATENPVEATMIGRAYQPGALTVGLGQTVRWQNQSITHHTVTSTDGAFESSSIAPGESYSITFSHPGTFDYECRIHPTMKGSVVVLDLPAGTLHLRLSVRHSGHGVTAVAHVQSARSGPVLVQARTGSTWQTVAHGMLDVRGAATLTLARTAHRTLRVVLPAELGQPRELSHAERSPV